MTILPAVYTSERSPSGRVHYQGVELECAAAMPWVEAAAISSLSRLYGDPRSTDTRMDRRSLVDFTEQFVQGFKGEAAFAMHNGLSLEGMLTSDWRKLNNSAIEPT